MPSRIDVEYREMKTSGKQKEQLLNWDKFKAAIHYVCEKATDPSCLGSIKLNKVLWYSDSINYLIAGKSITGETYIKRQFGPVPPSASAAIGQLVHEGKIARGKVNHFGFMKREYISVTQADKNAFTAAEISLIDAAFEHVCINHTAMSISDETHDVIWKIARMGEPIPYYTAFAAATGEVDESDMQWAKEKLGIISKAA
jgi:hypothetical protein